MTTRSRTDQSSEADRIEPDDETEFRQLLQELLVSARENDIEFSNQCWTCVSETSEQVWDVEITAVAPGRKIDR